LYQAVDNLEAIIEPDQLTNASDGRRVRKRRRTRLVNNAWDSNPVFLRGTVMCQYFSRWYIWLPLWLKRVQL